ncbi:MAG: hypothetical protein HQ575_03805 [Candidatus Omnitrophica bacterium]|nr:hypothetical protein [Candidatus Omnitrophota bacterium]
MPVKKPDYTFDVKVFKELLSEDEKFLKETARQTVGKRGDRYNDTRSIVLNVHFGLEQLMNRIIAFSCSLGVAELGRDGRFKELVGAFSGMDYFKKLSITRALSVFSKESISILTIVNNVRRAFAHNYKEGHSDYKYKGTSIFNKETISKLLEDRRKIFREGSNLIIGYTKRSK